MREWTILSRIIDVNLVNMKCIQCERDVCSCQLKGGICKSCRKLAESQPIEQSKEDKINITVQLPKQQESELRSKE